MSLKRPRALWKLQDALPTNCLAVPFERPPHYDSETDDDDDTGSSQSSKRQRSTFEQDVSVARTSIQAQLQPLEKETCDLEDWERLKESFVHATELYEDSKYTQVLPLLRALIHECNRFMRHYHDPSVIFTEPPSPSRHRSGSPDFLTPPEERLQRDWGCESARPPSRAFSRRSRRRDGQSRLSDPPTAFHTVVGSALYLSGNIVARDSSLTQAGEPTDGMPYWLAALDVFETGENLPSNMDSHTCGNEDWRMAVAWGCTLARLADARAAGRAIPTEPDWPCGAPPCTAAQPPIPRRVALAAATAHDIMVLAMDQFSRGILYMPHPVLPAQEWIHTPGPDAPDTCACMRVGDAPFSRAAALFGIANDVLRVAAKLVRATERLYWAQSADGVFSQIGPDADSDSWRARVAAARGRCWLLVGSARAEELGVQSPAGGPGINVLGSEEAQDARDALTQAIAFIECAKACGIHPSDPELPSLSARALYTLANLTLSKDTREDLYNRAQAMGNTRMEFDPVEIRMDQSE